MSDFHGIIFAYGSVPELGELVRESTMGIVRAGADLIISYWASRYNEFFRR